MAVDKLVDSTQLDSDLTSVANAIRAKSGGSSQLAFPAGFVSEIGNIPSGGGGGINNWKGRMVIGCDSGQTAPVVNGDITINAPDSSLSLQRFLQGATKASGVTNAKLTINCSSVYTTSYILYRSAAITEVEINCSNGAYVYNGTSNFQGTSTSNMTSCSVKKVSGTPISLSANTSGSYSIFKYNNVIEDVGFYENSSTQTVEFANCSKFTNATLISIANALKVSEGSASLSLHATPKARLSSIMGTVSQKTRSDVTYDFFTADENGTVSLQYFITNTKGWTLA